MGSTVQKKGMATGEEFRMPMADARYAVKIMLLLAGLIMIVMYIEGMLTPSLPSIAHEFKISTAEVSLVLAMYLVSGTALNPIMGKLADLYGRKKVLNYILIIYSIAVVSTGFSPNFAYLIASRTVQGVGLGIMPVAMSIIREQLPKNAVPRAQGIFSAMFGVGGAISLPLGAFVSNHFGWRMTYHTAIPFVIFLTILSVYIIKASPYRKVDVSVDYKGAATLSISLALLVLGISLAPTWGWQSWKTIALMLVGISIFPFLVLMERRVKEPILDSKLLSIRNVMLSNLSLFVVGFGMFLAMQAFAYNFESPSPSGYGFDIFETGVAMVPFSIAQLIFGPISGILVTRTGVKPISMIGAIVGGFGYLFTSFASSPHELMLAEFFDGAGIALLMGSVINFLIFSVEMKDMSIATSMNAVFRTFGSSLGAPIAGTLMATYFITVKTTLPSGVVELTKLPSPTAFHIAFYIASAAFFMIAVIILFSQEVLGKKTAIET